MTIVDSSASPYAEVLDWLRKHPGTGSANGLAKLILSLWNTECAFSYRECTDGLDDPRTALAERCIDCFNRFGEIEELRRVGAIVCDMYPRLWDLGQAADNAKVILRQKWREDDLRAEDEAERRP